MFKVCHFDQSIILLCVRWYLSYGLSLRDLREMMAERGISVDHSTIHRWVVHFAPLLLEGFNRRKRAVTGKWHVDETYIKVRERGMYLYRAIDSVGDTVEFHFSEHRDFFAMSMGRGTFCGPSRSPETPFSRWPRAEALATAAPVEPEPERGDVEPSGISRHLTTLTVARPYARRREWG